MENIILQKEREYPLIIPYMLNILHTEDRYNIKLKIHAKIKKISYLYEKIHILKRITEWTLNIGHMLKIFPLKFKYNIAIYKLNI